MKYEVRGVKYYKMLAGVSIVKNLSHMKGIHGILAYVEQWRPKNMSYIETLIIYDALLECTAKIIIVGCSYLLIVTNQTVHSMLRIFMPIYCLVHRPYRSSKSHTSMKQMPRASKSNVGCKTFRTKTRLQSTTIPWHN
jgi:hypothetical protein